MSRSSRSDRARRRRGFTLAEAIVSLVILILVMTVALTLLFSMKSFAERQQVNTVPRQAARRAIDYVSYYLTSATDLNWEFGNPNAIQVWYEYCDHCKGKAPSVDRQATYNNLTSAQSTFGTPGTDIISVGVPVTPLRIPISVWPGNDNAASTMWLNYRRGCPDDTLNLNMFKAETGAHQTGGQWESGVLSVVDATGRWVYIQITTYNGSNCSAADDKIIHVTINPSGDRVNPPGGWRDDLIEPITLAAGIDFTSFRHRVNPTTNVPALEQKVTGVDAGGTFRMGFFDPTSDNPGTAFVPVVENVEDFQVAYVFNDGAIFNTEAQTLPSAQNEVPTQNPSDTVNCGTFPRDILCVQALRVTMVGRSLPMNLGTRNLADWNLKLRPRAEDRAAATAPDTLATGIFDRYRQTTTVMIRNRTLGW